mgnify:CR=1 FL=1
MAKDMVWGVARAVLAAGGGYIAGKGIMDQSTVNEVIGALGVLFAAGWSVASKKKAAAR